MAKIYVKEELGTKVQQLRNYFDVVTASSKGIIMLTRDDWNKVCKYIADFDDKYTKDCNATSFLGESSLWTICFWICCYNDDEDSFWAIADHDMFIRVCHACGVQPVLLECIYNIPDELFSNAVGCKPLGKYNFEIEMEDN